MYETSIETLIVTLENMYKYMSTNIHKNMYGDICKHMCKQMDGTYMKTE